jgi:hypothetical protein
MGDLFGLIIEQLMTNRWWRYGICGLVIAGTIYGGDFSTALPWVVLAIVGGWLVLHELIDRHLKSKRRK